MRKLAIRETGATHALTLGCSPTLPMGSGHGFDFLLALLAQVKGRLGEGYDLRGTRGGRGSMEEVAGWGRRTERRARAGARLGSDRGQTGR